MRKKLKIIIAVTLTAAMLISASPVNAFAKSMRAETQTDSDADAFYSINYYLTENEKYGEPQTYREGDIITPPKAPEKDGYVFAGWVLGKEENAESFTPLPEKMPARDLDAYASWELKKVNVSFVSDGKELFKKEAPYGSSLTELIPADPAREGYKFGGWFDEEGNNVYDYKTVPVKDTVFTAKWLRSGNVTFLVDGKTYEVYQLNEGDTIKKPANPEKFGQKFVRWDPEIPAIMPDKDLTFNAVFEVDKDFVTLVIGGTVIAGSVIAAIVGGGTLTITGLSIIGGIIALIGGSSLLGKQYTVTYKVDGSVYKTYKVKAGATVPVPSNPKKSGYTFAGWTPDVPDKMPKSNLTFEAQWKSGSDEKIPDTGSGSVGLTVFAMLGLSSVLFAVLRKKKES